MPIRTLAELFLRVEGHDKAELLLHKVDGAYRPISTAEFSDRVRRLAKALAAMGIAPGDRVALMSDNAPHWPIIDFATQALGAVLVPIYPTLTAEQAAYIANDCGARIVFAQTVKHLEGFLTHRADLAQVETLVGIDPAASGEGVESYAALLERGAGHDRAHFDARARGVRPEDLATFIYTSGTTGTPKGVMLTHDNIVTNLQAALAVFAIEKHHVALSFLPLSHSFERTVDYTYFHQGTTIAYAESVNTVPQNLQEVRPHLFVAVPRVYEKFLGRVNEGVAAASPIRQKLFHWAIGVGKKALPYRLNEEKPGGLLGLQLALADKLVFSKVKARLGGRFQYALSGGAPLARDLAEFFWGIGVPIFEGYGLSETSPVLSVNYPKKVRLGSVGPAVQRVTLKIAGDGEILAKGPNIMQGYWKLPEATAEVIDAEGWFHTGDIGEIDGDGFLRITDRKKELIVNANGKNIAPAPIENALKGGRFIGQAVVIGDRRKFLSALLVPNFDALTAWAERQGLPKDRAALLTHPEVRKAIGAEVDAVNKNLAKFEQVVAWEILPEEFTLEGGELTPTLKIKRRIINQKYADAIERLYSGTAEK